MDGGNGKIVSLLERIVEEQQATRLEVAGMRAELNGMREDIAGMREDIAGMREDQHSIRIELVGLRRDVNTRIDNVIAFMGTHHGDHEERIRVLEERVLGKSG